FGNAQLSVSDAGLLLVNLRHLGGPDRSPCSFWFQAPITTKQWETASTPLFQLRLAPGQFAVAENCGSPYDDSQPLFVAFSSPADGEAFMNLMAALELQHSAIASKAAP